MSAHTPGPWELYDCDDPSIIGRPRNIHAECQSVKHSGTSIAKVYSREGFEDEREANARLIAAAPELLAALIALRDWCDSNITQQSRCIPVLTPSIMHAADKAIAKAIGKAQP